MNKTGRFLLCLFITMTLVMGLVGEASAKRLGGGKSFGSRPSYSEPYRAPSNASPGYQAQNPAYRSPAAERNQAARDAMGRRGGFMGMLGGLALGGLLGAMLFGGAFEGIKLFDILIFAAIAFMLYKLLAARRATSVSRDSRYGTAATGPAGESADVGGYDAPYQRRADSARPATSPAGFDTDILFRKGGAGASASVPSPAALPQDFDLNAFMAGARSAYEQMQQAWDRGDLADLRALTTDKVFGELQDQLRGRSGDNRTELLNIDARLLDVRDEGSERVATVLFDVLMREAPGEEPQQVREVWHFMRPRNSKQPTWFLDGLQQLDQ